VDGDVALVAEKDHVALDALSLEADVAELPHLGWILYW